MLSCRPSVHYTDGPTVVVVCIQGMRHDQPDRVEAPAFAEMARSGSRASRLLPVFPANSLPNDIAVLTGLRPARSGLINSVFLDRKWDWTFQGEEADIPHVIRREPIWLEAERHGIATGVIDWSGVADPPGPQPGRVSALRSASSDGDRVQELIGWLEEAGPAAPRLIFLYLGELDAAAHRDGPDGAHTLAEVRDCDAHVGAILRALTQHRGRQGATLVVLSNHGMSSVSRAVYLDARLVEKGVDATTSASGITANVYLEGDMTPEEARNRLAGDAELYETVLASEAAKRWGYDDAARVGDLVLVAGPGVYFHEAESEDAAGSADARASVGPAVEIVVHGGPPEDPDMAGTLWLWGRGVPPGKRWDDVSILDIYPTIRKLLGLPHVTDIDGHPLPGVG